MKESNSFSAYGFINNQGTITEKNEQTQLNVMELDRFIGTWENKHE